MADKDAYKIGDSIFFIDQHDRPMKKARIKCMRQFRVNTKMILEDDSEWDARTGRPWSSRGKPFYWGARIGGWSEELQNQFESQIGKDALRWCVEQWGSLTEEQRAELGKLAIGISERGLK